MSTFRPEFVEVAPPESPDLLAGAVLRNLTREIPVHAEWRDQIGITAALSILRVRQGSFRFNAQPLQIQPTVTVSLSLLIKDAAALPPVVWWPIVSALPISIPSNTTCCSKGS